ncbi:MAG: sn-glycerol-1-phosphate dehydrogenase [Eubacteriales bacterium]
MNQYKSLLDTEIQCTCGGIHYVPIKEINLDFQIEDILCICKTYFLGKNILIVGDEHTRVQINDKIIEVMRNSDYNISVVQFKDKKLVPDEKAVGSILMATPRDIHGIISIGSGTINDLNRLIGDRLKIPVITIATAPSMDGYAAAGSSLMFQGAKKTIKGSPVTVIVGNIDVIKDCPYELIQAGFGDIIGKKTAIADWSLSKHLTGEYWCNMAVDLVIESTELCISNVDSIAKRDKNAIKQLTEALVLSGIAMSIVDDTRPASGGEHLISHYMVMKAIGSGNNPPSHGKTVAIGTLITTILYYFLFDSIAFNKIENHNRIQIDIMKYLPTVEDVRCWLNSIQLPDHPRAYDITETFMREIILNAGFIRERYTIFSLLHQLDILHEAAEYMAHFFYHE